MSRRFRALVVLAFASLLVPSLTATAAPAGRGPQRITGASPLPPGCADMERGGFGTGFQDAEAEISLAVDPRDPSRLVMAWMQDLYAGYVTASSRDSGASWTVATVPGTSGCSGGDQDLGVDPWVSYGPDGRVYLAGFSLDLPDPAVPTPVRSRLQVSTSTDNGRTWSAPAEVAGGDLVLHDKPAVTADPDRHGAAYLTWTDTTTAFGPTSTGVHFARTDDGGSTWSAPQRILAPNPPTSAPLGSELLVLPDGSLLVVATLLPAFVGPAGHHVPHLIQAVRSSDRGATWSAVSTVAAFDTGDESFQSGTDPDSGDQLQAPSAFVGADVGPGGTVHVVWRHALATGVSEIRIANSSDGGASWSAPRTVAAPGASAFLPNVAVAGNGSIGVTYHDLRRDVRGDSAFTADVWLATSRDGITWQEQHLAGPVDLRTAPQREVPAQGRFVGDYHGLVALPHGFAAAVALPAPYAVVGATDVFLLQGQAGPGRGQHGSGRR